MTDIREILSRIRRQANAATEEPWYYHRGHDTPSGWQDAYVLDAQGEWVIHEAFDKNAEFIAESRTTIPKLLDSVEDALELHRSIDVEVIPWDCGEGDCDHEDDEHPTETMTFCDECYRLALDVYPYYGENGCSAVLWPCPTVEAITRAPERETDD